MSKLKFYIKRKGNYYTNLIISYSVLLVLILFIGLYLYNISKEKLIENIQKQTMLQLSSSVTQLADSFNSMENLSLALSKNSDIRYLSRMSADKSNEFYQAGYKAQVSISNYSITQRLLPITYYFIYFNNSEYILSYSSFTSIDLYYKSLFLSKSYYGHFKDTITNSMRYNCLIPMSEFKEISGDYLYIIPLNSYLFYDVPAQLCFIVDSSKLTEPFLPLTVQTGSSLYITSENGDILFSLGDTSLNITSNMLANLNFSNSNVLSETIRSTDVSIMKLSDTSTNYNFYYVLPNTSIQSLLSQYRNMFLLVIGAGISIGLLLLFVLSKRNVRPYVTMNTQLKDSISLAQQLQHTLDLQQPFVHTSYVRNLMLGRISSKDELTYIEECLGVTDTSRIYSVLYIVTYPMDHLLLENQLTTKEDNHYFIGDEILLYDTYIIPLLKKYFGEHIHMFSPKKYHYALIVSQKDVEEIEDAALQIKEQFYGFHHSLLETYSILSIAGLGKYNHFAENLWKSYQQALESVSYASGSNSICWYGSLKISSDTYYFPAQLSESLTNFITTGNKNQVIETFKFIVKENLEVRSLSYPKIQHLLMEIYNTLSRIRYTVPDTDVNAELHFVDNKLKEHLSFRQLEDIANELCNFFAQYTSQKQIITQIKNYIKENYKDASLCLAKLSDEFHLSESYLSYLFKEATGENFSMYLEQIRMEASLKLVKDTSVPLSDLYLEVGYNNANSFRRVFKKTYGTSAKAIRDSLKA